MASKTGERGHGGPGLVEVSGCDREVVLEPSQERMGPGRTSEGLDDLGVVAVQRGVVAHEEEDDEGERGQKNDVDGAIKGDEPKDVAIPQQRAPERQLDLVPGRDALSARMLGGMLGDPRVAPQTVMPTQAVVFTDEHRIGVGHLGGVEPHQHVTLPTTGEELVAIGRPRPHVGTGLWRPVRRAMGSRA